MKSDYRKVTLTGGYWKAKEELVKTVTTNAVYDRFNESGRIDAFKCDWTEEVLKWSRQMKMVSLLCF